MATEESSPGGTSTTRFFVNRDGQRKRPAAGLLTALWAVLAAGFGLRITNLARQDIWWDEARNIYVALRPLAQIAASPELDIQPPLYYWILHGWLKIAGLGQTASPPVMAFGARFLSVWFGVLAVALLYGLGRRLHGPTAGLTAASLAALSPLWLAESQESRMYTVGFALLLAAALALAQEFFRPDTDGRSSPPRYRTGWLGLLPLAGFSALALLTHYNTLFVLAAWYGLWGLRCLRRPPDARSLGRPLAAGLLTALLVSPWIPSALAQIRGYANPNLTVPTLPAYLAEIWRGFAGGYAWTGDLLLGTAEIWLWLTAAILLLGLGLAFSDRLRRQDLGRGIPIPFLLTWFLGSLALYYVAVLDRGAFNIRYASFATPALYGLLGIAVAAYQQRSGALAAAILLVLMVGSVAGIDADRTDPRFFREDTAGLAQWLAQEARPEDLILVDQKFPFGFHYSRFALEPDVQPVGPEPAPARYLFVDAADVAHRLNQYAAHADRVFWVQWFESDTDPRDLVRFLLDQAGPRIADREFQGYRVNWWQLSPPTHFELAPALIPALHGFRVPGQGGIVETLRGSLPRQPVLAGTRIPVVLQWQRRRHGPDRALKARVALYDAAQNRIAQDDRRLLNDRHLAPPEWEAESPVLNVYAIRTPSELPAGTYRVGLLVYDAETLEPLEALDTEGNPGGQERILGQVRVVAP